MLPLRALLVLASAALVACASGGTSDGAGAGGSPDAASQDVATVTDGPPGDASAHDATSGHDASLDASDGDGGPCTEGALQCSGETPETCTGGVWVQGSICVFACSNGGCAGVCTPGTHLCSGKQPQTCDSTGTWQPSGSPCQAQCVTGMCAPACTPGATQCTGLQPQTCDSTGTWQDTGGACPYVCSAGACAGSCVPGTAQCNGPTPQTCDATGTWKSGSACPYACSAGACTGVCAPGSKQCAGDGVTPQTCSSTGTWQSSSTCPYTCSAGVCAGSCTTGSMQGCSTSCGTTGSATCTSSATWGTCAPPGEACNLIDDDCNGRCDDVGGCRTGVDRSYDASTGEHFYTTSDSEASCCGFTVETYGYYYLYAAAQPGLVPFYRCALTSGFHLYTTDPGCEGAGTSEGAMGYIAGGAVCGSVPLYRLSNAANGDHLYTTSMSEVSAAEAGGYVLEQTAGYVWTGSQG